MWFSVFDSDGDLLYEGSNWSMARVALDRAVMKNNGCPALTIVPIPDAIPPKAAFRPSSASA